MITKQNKKKGAFYKPSFFISYLITDPLVYGSSLEQFKHNLTIALKNNSVDMVCFRDKQTKDIQKLAKICLEVSREFSIKKVLINSDIKLANELNFDGVHLTSMQFDKIELAKSLGLFTIISTHNEDEIELAKSLGSDAITYSPIFYKENKGEPKGLENLTKVVQKYQDDTFKIIALGGIISNRNIEDIIFTKSAGFASIRYYL